MEELTKREKHLLNFLLNEEIKREEGKANNLKELYDIKIKLGLM